MADTYIILGAGIVGASCALALRRDGHEVVLVDRDEPGRGASYGNAGLIQTGTPLPMATPGVIRALPKMLTDPESPLVVRWSHLPRLIPWLWRFLRASQPAETERISIALAALLDHAGEAYRALLKEMKKEDLVRYRGLLFVYRDDAEMSSADWEFDLYRRRGVTFERLEEDALWQMEPALNHDYRRAYYLSETFFTVNPLRLTQSIVEHFQAAGGRVKQTTAESVEHVSDGSGASLRLHTADGTIQGDKFVLAAGAFSNRFAKQLGFSVPLESGRGYHLMLRDPAIPLQGPIIDGYRHFGVVPMEGGVRLAGLMELAGLDAPPNYRRADMLLPLAKIMVPGLKDDNVLRWMGHRPITPDSLPVIGWAPGSKNVLLAFGHGQLGLTMGPLTGRIVADLAAGRTPVVDLAPFAPDRF